MQGTEDVVDGGQKDTANSVEPLGGALGGGDEVINVDLDRL
jgi:hypothetical protein